MAVPPDTTFCGRCQMAVASNGWVRPGPRGGATLGLCLTLAVSIAMAACGATPVPPTETSTSHPEGASPTTTTLAMPSVGRLASPSQSAATSEPSSSPPKSPGPTQSPRPKTGSNSLPAYVSHGPRTRKWIALTFDADMYPWMYAERDRVSMVDLRIVDLLEATHTPATIFLNGLFVRAYSALTKRLASNPNIELANHSWDHAGWISDCRNTTPIRPPMTRRTEVTTTEAIIDRVTGVKVQFFRFPGFCSTSSDVALVRSLGETSIGSDCFFGDAFGWSARRQVASVEGGCIRGSIVVTHLNGPPFHPYVYEALKTLIPWWKARGWKVVTVGQLLGHPTP